MNEDEQKITEGVESNESEMAQPIEAAEEVVIKTPEELAEEVTTETTDETVVEPLEADEAE